MSSKQFLVLLFGVMLLIITSSWADHSPIPQEVPQLMSKWKSHDNQYKPPGWWMKNIDPNHIIETPALVTPASGSSDTPAVPTPASGSGGNGGDINPGGNGASGGDGDMGSSDDGGST